MSDIAEMIASKAGISPELARKGLGVLLVGLKKFAPEIYPKVVGHISGAGALESAFTSAEAGESSGGLMGSLSGLASKVLNGDSGNAAELMQMFSKAGFSMDQVKDFAPKALEQLKTVVPPDVVDQICEKLPGLDKVT